MADTTNKTLLTTFDQYGNYLEAESYLPTKMYKKDKNSDDTAYQEVDASELTSLKSFTGSRGYVNVFILKNTGIAETGAGASYQIYSGVDGVDLLLASSTPSVFFKNVLPSEYLCLRHWPSSSLPGHTTSFSTLKINQGASSRGIWLTVLVTYSDSIYKFYIHLVQKGYKASKPTYSQVLGTNGKEEAVQAPSSKTIWITSEATDAIDKITFKKFMEDSPTPVSLRSEDTFANNFVKITTPEEASIEYTFGISFTVNNSGVRRSTTIRFVDNDTNNLVQQLTVIQTAKEDTIPEDTSVIDWSKFEKYSCIDNNRGEDVDASSLLYKGNSNNIYKTIEQKDNTLFVGNYTPFTDMNTIQSIVQKLVNDSNVKITTDAVSVGQNQFYTDTGGAYSYQPNMKLSSQERKLFKKGETYLMGLVFLSSTGQRSSVYYLDQWNPNSEPYVNSSRKLVKPKYVVQLNSEVSTQLLANNIIGVMPVYASKETHKIIAQGFLSCTIQNSKRKSLETLDAQYSWYQRFTKSIEVEYVPLENDLSPSDTQVEFQNIAGTDSNDNSKMSPWVLNKHILTLNTPEVESSLLLTNADLADCKVYKLKDTYATAFQNNITLNYVSKYLHSGIKTLAYDTTERISRALLWDGFLDDGKSEELSSNADFMDKQNDKANYKSFFVYLWQRSKIGGESPEHKIESKKFFDSVFLSDASASNVEEIGTPLNSCIYRDADTNSIMRVGHSLYQGNVDYAISIESPYKLWGKDVNGQYVYPRAWERNTSTSTFYSGYNKLGECYDPIVMKYKSAPHIAMYFDQPYLYNSYDEKNSTQPKVVVAQIEKGDSYKELDPNSPSDKMVSQWIKCGDQVAINAEGTTITFEEGDYFYGRYDSLRTYPYTEMDINSVTEIVSGMLCSRINLDARTDRNRGASTPIVYPDNFNLFNTVYDQLNNYFTYQWIDDSDLSIGRNFVNTIQWSLTKQYGSAVDDWCNIQEANSLDLDGDKGELVALRKLNNNILAFQKTGISQILYNESMQVQSQQGLPIEIANSGKVNGKRYLFDNIGCQRYNAITNTPNGIYFIDGINKTGYMIGLNLQISDIYATYGMKTWALKNLTSDWWCYYDKYTQEVIFASNKLSLAFDDVHRRFQCFLNYEGIKHHANLNARTYLFQNQGTYMYTWKKNAIDYTRIFGDDKIIAMLLIPNPEPTLDKTFSNVEYRADCFDMNNIYLPDETFTRIRVWNEYQDTGIVPLSYNGTYNTLDAKGSIISSKNIPSNLKKKFRIWHIQIPRATYGSQLYTNIQGSGNMIPDIVAETTPISIEGESYEVSRDRIRNPWCALLLRLENSNVAKIVVHDMQMQYFY